MAAVIQKSYFRQYIVTKVVSFSLVSRLIALNVSLIMVFKADYIFRCPSQHNCEGTLHSWCGNFDPFRCFSFFVWHLSLFVRYCDLSMFSLGTFHVCIIRYFVTSACRSGCCLGYVKRTKDTSAHSQVGNLLTTDVYGSRKVRWRE